MAAFSRDSATQPFTKAQQILGCLLVFVAALCFYLSTAAIRWSAQHVAIAPAFFVFIRFLLGFLLVCLMMIIRRQRLRPKRYSLLVGRAAANGIAVYCFYTAVTKTSVAEANILNMTYPVFVALLSWIFLKQQRDRAMSICALVAFVGIWLVLGRGTMALDLNHLWGLCSGFSGSLAVIFLNLSRRHHDTQTVLFYLFGLGAIFTYTAFHTYIHWPTAREAYYLILCSGLAIIGQYCITFGYRYVTAVEGGIIASSRILLAAALGPFIAGDPWLTSWGWLGAAIIFSVNAFLAWRKAR